MGKELRLALRSILFSGIENNCKLWSLGFFLLSNLMYVDIIVLFGTLINVAIWIFFKCEFIDSTLN